MTLQELYEALRELMEDDKHAAEFADLPVKSNQFDKLPWDVQSVRVKADYVELVH